jgi:lipid-binding SYLF domain-containing protein
MKLTSIALACLCTGALYAETSTARLNESAAVLSEIMGAPDGGVPHDLLEKAQCIVIVPGLKKGAFLFGGKYGRGYIVCREQGHWSAPAGVTVEGGSFGFQIGGEETDAVMLVMNRDGEAKLLQSKFTLGGDASVAAGSVGRTSSAETDLQMHAEILTWSRSRGVFAGISLQGATLRPDAESNKEMYHHNRSNQQIVMDKTAAPAGAARLEAELAGYSAHKD